MLMVVVFTIPSGYPSDSFYLGAGNWAQSGEQVNIVPENQKNQPVQAYIDVRELAKAIAEAQQLGGK